MVNVNCHLYSEELPHINFLNSQEGCIERRGERRVVFFTALVFYIPILFSKYIKLIIATKVNTKCSTYRALEILIKLWYLDIGLLIITCPISF